jgi:hypothetical protein
LSNQFASTALSSFYLSFGPQQFAQTFNQSTNGLLHKENNEGAKKSVNGALNQTFNKSPNQSFNSTFNGFIQSKESSNSLSLKQIHCKKLLNLCFLRVA